MKKVTVIPFQTNYALNHHVISYFEIDDDNRITLCYVAYFNPEIIIKRDISHNDEYAKWLLQNTGLYRPGQYQEETVLEYLFKNNHWFVSLEHYDQPTKYIVELQKELGDMEKKVESLEK